MLVLVPYPPSLSWQIYCNSNLSNPVLPPWLSVIDLNQIVFPFTAKIGEKRLNQNMVVGRSSLGSSNRIRETWDMVVGRSSLGKDAAGRIRCKIKERAVSWLRWKEERDMRKSSNGIDNLQSAHVYIIYTNIKQSIYNEHVEITWFGNVPMSTYIKRALVNSHGPG